MQLAGFLIDHQKGIITDRELEVNEVNEMCPNKVRKKETIKLLEESLTIRGTACILCKSSTSL